MASLQERLLPFANGNVNMARTFDEDGTETGSISERMDKKKRLAQRPKDMKDFEFESIQRQYSGKDYTIEDKKNVINYYKRQKKGKV